MPVLVISAIFGFINILQKRTIDIPYANQQNIQEETSVSSDGQKETQKNIINVPYISQEGLLATGCELISSMMVLDYYGYDVTVDELLARTPQSILTQSDSRLVGPHPSEAFIGDPLSLNGLGCYAPVITSVMNSFFAEDSAKEAVDVTGTDLETLIQNYIKQDTPVIIWATINMQPPKQGKSWIIKDTGETFQWIAREHSLVLVGYDKTDYYFNDPYDSNGLIGYEKGLVEDRFRALGKQAIVVNS